MSVVDLAFVLHEQVNKRAILLYGGSHDMEYGIVMSRKTRRTTKDDQGAARCTTACRD